MDQLLTLTMIVKDEELFLPQCLASVQSVVDEMVVVDTGSSDRTVEIARSFGARVIEIAWPNDFAKARNVGLEAVTTPWVLIMDADEEFLADDKDRLADAIRHPRADAYNIRIVSVMDRAEDISESYVTRVVRSHPHVRFRGAVHEQLFQSLVEAQMTVHQLDVRLIHKGYINAVVTARNKGDRNQKLLESHVAANPTDGYMLWQLAQTYYGRNAYQAAVAASQRALRHLDVKNPIWVLAQNTYAKALLAVGQNKKSLRILREGRLAFPDYTDFWYMEGITLMVMQRWAEARERFQQCLHLGEAGNRYLMTDTGIGGFKALYRISQTYFRAGDAKTALAYLLLAIQQQPQYRSAWSAIFDVMAGSSFQAVGETVALSVPVETIIAVIQSWPNRTANEENLLGYLQQRSQPEKSIDATS